MSYNQHQQYNEDMYYNYAGWYPFEQNRHYDASSSSRTDVEPNSNNSNNRNNNGQYALTTTKRPNYSYENHPEYNNIARRYESRINNNRFKPYDYQKNNATPYKKFKPL